MPRSLLNDSLLNVIPFTRNSPSTSSSPLPSNPPLILGRFSVAEAQLVVERFHDGESMSRLAMEFRVGTSIIEELIRMPRKPMASSQQNDRRQRRAA
jgi:hypothetical protein